LTHFVEALLKDDLAILFAADFGPATSPVEMFGACTRLGSQRRRCVPALLQYIAGKGEQRASDAASFVKGLTKSAQIDPSRWSAAEKPWIAPCSSQTQNVELSKSQSTSRSIKAGFDGRFSRTANRIASITGQVLVLDGGLTAS
jgi:hypothetical protein